ncbi:MAG TPA: SBBP repeat-containing protein, partial [Terriglobia bacterium]|nr:SBBP repeat-containing protein [Terriglobia bacterium]
WAGSRASRVPSQESSLLPVSSFLSSATNPSARPQVIQSYGQLPLMFEPNVGQTDARVQFIARGTGYGLFLTKNGAVLSLLGGKSAAERSSSVIRMNLVGANSNAAPAGLDVLPGKSNYFLGNDPKRWHRNVSQYARVRYASVYPGVDLVYYGSQGQLEYDFEVAPGANPKSVQLRFEGAQKLALEGHDLVLTTRDGSLRLEAPRVYQTVGDSKKPVDGKFVLLAQNTVGFEFGAYDSNHGLVIDPVLTYSTYLGGSGAEVAPTIAVDSAFNFYVAGSTTSTDFPVPTTPAPLQATLKGSTDVFVAKFNSSGTPLVFATYLGGSDMDTASAVGVDAGFNVYLAGTTKSSDFPTNGTTGAYQPSPKAAGTHGFVTKLAITQSDQTQSLAYSTYLSGSGTDTISGLALDNKSQIYVIGTTTSTDFPIAPSQGAFQNSLLGPIAFFVSELNPTVSADAGLVYSTYFGGSFPTNATVTGGGIAVDNNSAGANIYITGGTNFQFNGNNNDWPIKNAFQSCLDSPQNACNQSNTKLDAFIAKLNPINTAGAQLVYSTYLGGSGDDIGTGIGLDSAGNAYISGVTNSSDFIFPTATVAHQKCLNNPTTTTCTSPDTTHTDAFVGKVTNPAAGSSNTNVFLSYFSYLGGSGNDAANAIAVDTVQGARITGITSSSDLPVLNAVQSTLGGGTDAFVARLYTAATGTSTVSLGEFISYLGGSGNDRGTGIAVDSNATTYVAGETQSTNFPVLGAFQATYKGSQDAFAAKLSPTVNLNVTASTSATSVNAGNQATFTYTITNQGDTTAGVAFVDNLASSGVTATFVSATASGGTCPTSATNNTIICNVGVLNGGATATVSVTLTPTGPGTLGNSGSVIVAGSPFTKSASASVQVTSYTLDVQPPSVTVAAGNTATYTATVTPSGNYTASISLSCPSGLPSGTGGCTFSTNPITLSGTSPSSVQISITTTARTSTTGALRHTGPIYAIFLPIGWLTLLG